MADRRISPEEAGRIIEEERARKIMAAREAQEREEYNKSLKGIIANKASQIAGNAKDRVQSTRAYNYAQEKANVFVKVAAESTVKSSKFWSILGILFLISLILVWYYNLWSYIFTYIFTVIAAILFFIIIIWGFFFDPNKYSKWIAWAFVVWLIDLIPAGIPFFGWLGAPYAGFEFNILGTLNTNWLAVGTSSLFLLLLFLDWILNVVEKKYLAAFISFVFIIMINRLAGWLGFRYLTQWSYANYVFGIILFIFLFLAFKFRRTSQDPDFFAYPSFLTMALVFSFFFSVNTGWMSNVRAWIHVAFILLFGFVYIRKNEKDDPGLWHLLIPGLLLADFYLYNIAWLSSNSIAGLQFLPVLVFFVITYCLKVEENATYATTAIIFLGIIFLIFSIPAYASGSTSIGFEARKGVNIEELSSTFADRVREIIEGRLDIATAGLYRANVEKNRYESLGVYFANIRAADPKFYQDEPITVWGSIRSKTYKDAVIVNFSCYRWKDNKKIRADKIIPDIKFPIFTLEEVDTECTFLPKDRNSPDVIKPGPNIITFSTEYNFGTDAYIKAYFMDRDRFREYSREDVDPLAEFGIKDKKPVAVFTNGPVEIGLDTGQPLITVSEGYAVKPSIGITLTNRQEIQDKNKKIITRWEGKIKNITELILLTPPGIELKDTESCRSDKPEEKIKCPCTKPFYEYDVNKCGNTCTLQVSNPCKEACFSSYGAGNKRNLCNKECDDVANNCIKECDRLFQVDEGEGSTTGKYKGYALDVGSLEFRDLNKDIDKHRSFLCRFDADQSVLDNTPITTRYFRVRARYNYLLENSVTVNVEQVPVETISTVPEPLAKTASEFIQVSGLRFDGLTSELVSAIASIESSFKHCCVENNQGKGTKCTPSSDKSCDFDRLITSGSSYGIMQIKYNTNASKKEVNNLAGKYCEGKSINDYDCNVKVGIAILKAKYDAYKSGCKETSEYKSGDIKKYPTLINACNSCTSTIDGTLYSSYRNVEAAIRGYNGWGCDSRFDRGYVEKVKRASNTLKGVEIIDSTTLRGIVRGGEGMYDPESIQSEEALAVQASQKPLPPTNAKAFDTPNARNSITISWTQSNTPNVRYLVYRYKEQSSESLTSYYSVETKYVDTNAEDGVNYYYRITAYNDFEESNYVETPIVKSIDDTSIFPPVGGTT